MYNKNNENIKIHMFSRNSIYPLLRDGAFSAHINLLFIYYLFSLYLKLTYPSLQLKPINVN